MDYQNSFDNFLSGGSTDASRKVWCKSLKLPRRSLKKYVFHLLQFCEWKVRAKVGMAYTKAECKEHIEMRFNNVWHIKWELGAKNAFCIENNATCWSFLVCESQGPFYSTSMNFISKSVMVWAQCQILNQTATRAPPSGRSVNLSSDVLRRALTINVLSFVLIQWTIGKI